MMLSFFDWLLDDKPFPPRWHCGNWGPVEGWAYVASSGAVALAYFVIAALLLRGPPRGSARRLPGQLSAYFAAFLFSCGAGHLVDAAMFWWPAYRLLSLVNVVTAAASLVAVVALARYARLLLSTASQVELDAAHAERAHAERARSHAELARSRAEIRLNTVVTSMFDAVVAMSAADGKVVFFNPAAERMFGYRAAEILGREVTVLIPLAQRAGHARALKRFLETGEYTLTGRVVEVGALRADGTEVPVELTLAHWRADGADYFTAVLRDITERLTAAKRVNEQRLALEGQVRQRQLLEHEIAALKALQETQSSQISLAAIAIEKLGRVTSNLTQFLGEAAHDDEEEEHGRDGTP